jgi:hypothetical protein
MTGLNIDRFEQFCERQDDEELANKRDLLVVFSMFVCALEEEEREEHKVY